MRSREHRTPLKQSTSRGCRTREPGKLSPRLGVEQLEDRMVPTAFASGEPFVVDFNALGGLGGILRGSSQVPVSQGGSFFCPQALAVESNGNFLVADGDAFGGPGGIIRVDPLSGAQTTV